MITYKVFLEDKLWHSIELFNSSSIVSAWIEWWRQWNEPLQEGDEGLELAMYIDGNYHDTLYYEEWEND